MAESITPPAECPAHVAVADPGPAPSRGRPPGPRGLPGIGVAPAFLRDPYGFLPRMAREYGDIVRIPMPGVEFVLLSDPEFINHVFNRHTARYHHMLEAVNAAVIPGGPPGLPIREGADHKRVRRVLNPTFSERSLAALGPLIADPIHEAVDGWERFVASGERVELQPELGIVVMAALANSLFSGAFDSAGIDDWVRRSAIHGRHFTRSAATITVLDALPGGVGRFVSQRRLPWLRRGFRNYDAIRHVIESQIAQRVAQPNESPDLLNLVLNAEFDDGSRLSHDEVRSELLALMFAGFETTAAVLAWSIGLLTQHPGELAAAHAEIDALGDVAVGYEHIEALPFLRACFDEAQRIQGAPLNLRVAKEDDEIGGYRIPAGAIAAVSLTGMHNDPRFWTRPEEFRPRRFLDDPIEKYAFMPFGVGPRRCLGMRMAYIEGLIALATILQRYRFELPAGWEPKPKYHLSTGLKSLPVTVHHRRTSRNAEGARP